MFSGSPAKRRYTQSVLLLSAAYILILFGVVAFFNNGTRSGLSAYAAAVLPALPIVGVFFAIGRFIVDERDEYQRMKLVRQALIATGITLSLATVWGFLENFGQVRHIYAYWAAIVWFAGLGVGGLVNRITFGDVGC
jgi:hypothetical protein